MKGIADEYAGPPFREADQSKDDPVVAPKSDAIMWGISAEYMHNPSRNCCKYKFKSLKSGMFPKSAMKSKFFPNFMLRLSFLMLEVRSTM